MTGESSVVRNSVAKSVAEGRVDVAGRRMHMANHAGLNEQEAQKAKCKADHDLNWQKVRFLSVAVEVRTRRSGPFPEA